MSDEGTILPANAWAVTLEGTEFNLLMPEIPDEGHMLPHELALVGCGLRLMRDPAFVVEMACWMEKFMEQEEGEDGTA